MVSAVGQKHKLTSNLLHKLKNQNANWNDWLVPLFQVIFLTVLHHFLFQSGMNVDRQILQLTQRREKLLSKLEENLCTVQSPHYLTKVPAHIREQIDSKVSAAFGVAYHHFIICVCKGDSRYFVCHNGYCFKKPEKQNQMTDGV